MPIRAYDQVLVDELGAAALAAAVSDIGLAESCPNWGADIKGYLQNLGIDYPAPYCAAAVSDWIVRGSFASQIAPPINPTALAKGIADQFQLAGRWIDAADATPALVRPGMIAVWDRATEAEPWRGHAAIVEHMDDDGHHFHTVEANIITKFGQGVDRLKRPLADARLMGFGVLSGTMPGEAALPQWWSPPQPPSRVAAPSSVLPAAVGFALGFGGVLIARRLLAA